MIERVVQYLRSHGVPFRLSSHPSPEAAPAVAHHLPPGGLFVETHVLLVGDRVAIACTVRGARVSTPGLEHELGAPIALGTADDLPEPFQGASGPVPPLGGAIGALTILDERVSQASVLAFEAFSSCDVFDIPYDDFARVERPRIASVAIGGELPAAEPEPGKRVARAKPAA